jgi:hypothetical protein
MSIRSDLYVASPDEIREAFAWLELDPVGAQPEVRDGTDAELAAYHHWLAHQPHPEPSAADRERMAALPSFAAKNVTADSVEALGALLGIEEARCDPSGLTLRAPDESAILSELPSRVFEAIARASEPELHGVVSDWLELPEVLLSDDHARVVLSGLRRLCQAAVAEHRNVYLYLHRD